MLGKNCEDCLKSDVCKNKDTFMKEEQKLEEENSTYEWLNIRLDCLNYLSKDSFIPYCKPVEGSTNVVRTFGSLIK